MNGRRQEGQKRGPESDSHQILLPRLGVFDLDYTLWTFYCECCYEDEMPYLYPHAKGILHAFRDKGIDVAIASISPTPEIAKPFLDKLGIRSMFVAQEIFSSWTHKTEHFLKIHRSTGVPYNSMLFFDNENKNIETKIFTIDMEWLKNGCSKHFGRPWGKPWRFEAGTFTLFSEVWFIWQQLAEMIFFSFA